MSTSGVTQLVYEKVINAVYLTSVFLKHLIESAQDGDVELYLSLHDSESIPKNILRVSSTTYTKKIGQRNKKILNYKYSITRPRVPFNRVSYSIFYDGSQNSVLKRVSSAAGGTVTSYSFLFMNFWGQTYFHKVMIACSCVRAC
ncbi:hypothetical protein GmHk_01G000976 [Glycine max]|nr:hypothetical protein GmHk_01G000976 [Glycine max]